MESDRPSRGHVRTVGGGYFVPDRPEPILRLWLWFSIPFGFSLAWDSWVALLMVLPFWVAISHMLRETDRASLRLWLLERARRPSLTDFRYGGLISAGGEVSLDHSVPTRDEQIEDARRKALEDLEKI